MNRLFNKAYSDFGAVKTIIYGKRISYTTNYSEKILIPTTAAFLHLLFYKRIMMEIFVIQKKFLLNRTIQYKETPLRYG